MSTSKLYGTVNERKSLKWVESLEVRALEVGAISVDHRFEIYSMSSQERDHCSTLSLNGIDEKGVLSVGVSLLC